MLGVFILRNYTWKIWIKIDETTRISGANVCFLKFYFFFINVNKTYINCKINIICEFKKAQSILFQLQLPILGL